MGANSFISGGKGGARLTLEQQVYFCTLLLLKEPGVDADIRKVVLANNKPPIEKSGNPLQCLSQARKRMHVACDDPNDLDAEIITICNSIGFDLSQDVYQQNRAAIRAAARQALGI